MSLFISLLGQAKEKFLKDNATLISKPSEDDLKTYLKKKQVPVCHIKLAGSISLIVYNEEQLNKAFDKSTNKVHNWYIVDAKKLVPPVTSKSVTELL